MDRETDELLEQLRHVLRIPDHKAFLREAGKLHRAAHPRGPRGPRPLQQGEVFAACDVIWQSLPKHQRARLTWHELIAKVQVRLEEQGKKARKQVYCEATILPHVMQWVRRSMRLAEFPPSLMDRRNPHIRDLIDRLMLRMVLAQSWHDGPAQTMAAYRRHLPGLAKGLDASLPVLKRHVDAFALAVQALPSVPLPKNTSQK